ncbi:MAG: GlsB/YeaQ/YmgE family stress response membrane protein [Chloroflexota bacterium]
MNISAIVVWIIIGLLSGTAASSVMGKRGRTRGGVILNTIIGLIGALIGGFLFDLFNINIATLTAIQINAQQLLAAFVGAILLILLVRILRRA